jgi:hypothetical protein
MGQAKNGILGPVTGKVSNLIWYKLQDKNVVRVAGKRYAALTSGEKLNTSKMKVLMAFFKSIKPFLKGGFSIQAKLRGINYHNMATSYNRKNAITLVNGKPEIDYANVLLSMGEGIEPQQASIHQNEQGIKFFWAWDMHDYEAAEDQVMMLAYMPSLNYAVFETAGAKRKTGEDFLPLLPTHLQEPMEIYMAFTSKDRKIVSNSVYLGRIN